VRAGSNGRDADESDEGGEDKPEAEPEADIEPDVGRADEDAAEELARNEAEGAPAAEREDRGRRRRRGRRGEGRRDDDAGGGAVSIPIETGGADEGTRLVASGDEVGLVDPARAEAPTDAALPNGAGEEAARPAASAGGAGSAEGPADAPEAAEPAATSEPEEPVAVVLTLPDPDRPKRAGWWSKAKAALGGS
jgi:ribonuclease E